MNIGRDKNVHDDGQEWQTVDVETHVPNAANLVEGVHEFLEARTIIVNDPHPAIIAFLILDIAKFVNMAIFGRGVLNLKYFFCNCVVFQHLGAVFAALGGKDEIVKLSYNADSNKVKNNVERVIRCQNHNQIADLYQGSDEKLHKGHKVCIDRVFEYVLVVHRVLHHNQSAFDFFDHRKM